MTSPYSSGNGGGIFESKVAAYYLLAVLVEGKALGVPGYSTTEVLTQRASFGEPLDDLVIIGLLENGEESRLSLQVKTSISFTAGNNNWLDVLGQAWETFNAAGYGHNNHMMGVAISTYNASVDTGCQPVIDWAKNSSSAENFLERVLKSGFSNSKMREFVTSTRSILSKHAKKEITDKQLWQFLRNFRILHFDFENEGVSRDKVYAVERLTYCLDPEQQNQAESLWNHLYARAAEMTKAGGGQTREILLDSVLKAGLPTIKSRTLKADIQKINRQSKAALDDIITDIQGLQLPREELRAQVETSLQDNRFVVLTGEAGAGKSALLKHIAEQHQQNGPIFLLSNDRVVDGGWARYAGQLGVTDDAASLLAELSAYGESPTLFIDGIDKINAGNGLSTLNDIIRAVSQQTQFSQWRILATARAQNIAELRTRLADDVLRALSPQTVLVQSLTEEELAHVTAQFPRLKPLFLEPGNVDIVLQRPFFLNEILRLSTSGNADEVPTSEVELMDLWWQLGGTESQRVTFTQEQRDAVLDLAERRLTASSGNISIRHICPKAIQSLKSSGVLQDVQLGHTVKFSHDIYEEWALCQWLIGQQEDIKSVLIANNQAEELVRPLQLFGSCLLENSQTVDAWQTLYTSLEGGELRSIWQRALLSSCLRSTRSKEILENLSNFLAENNGAVLRKLLSVLSTTEVRFHESASELFAKALLPKETRLLMAELFTEPNIMTWVRFLDWFLADGKEISPTLIPDVLPVFKVWQDRTLEYNARHCSKIGAMAYAWLCEFESALHPDFDAGEKVRNPFGINYDWDEERELEKALRKLFLFSAKVVPEQVKSYLEAKSNDRVAHIFRDDILSESVALSQYTPKELVDYIMAVFFRHPKDCNSRHNIGHHEQIELGYVGSGGSFYPASPYQMPFLALLKHCEEEGLRLILEICNYSIDVWQWFCKNPGFDDQALTPAPVTVEFSWGKQNFYGNHQAYSWFRGSWGNNACRSALMALEHWAFKRIKQGDDLAVVLEKITTGHQSVAILGVGVSLCTAHFKQGFESFLPLITCPHLWEWDIQRSIQERGDHHSNLIANWHRYSHLLEPVKAANNQEHRQRSIKDFVPCYVFAEDDAVREEYTKKIRYFENSLPYMYEEEKANATYTATLQQTMCNHMEYADPQYWHREPIEDGKRIKFWNTPPSASAPSNIQKLEDYAQQGRYLKLALWAQKSLEGGEVQDDLSLSSAWAEAKLLDNESISQDATDFDARNRAAGIAGVACMLAKFLDDPEWNEEVATWCANILSKAVEYQDVDEFHYRGTVLTMHPLLFAAPGCAALLARGHSVADCQNAILNLALHPYDAVAEAIATSSDMYATSHAAFYWEVFVLLVRRCLPPEGAIPNYHSLSKGDSELEYHASLLQDANNALSNNEPSALPAIPLPWVEGQDERSIAGEINGYCRNSIRLNTHLAARIILPYNIPVFFADKEHRQHILVLLQQLVTTTIQEIHPPFLEKRERRNINIPVEWVMSLFYWLAAISSHFSHAEMKSIALEPLKQVDTDKTAMAMGEFLRGILTHRLLPQQEIDQETMVIWEDIAEWVLSRQSLTHDYVDRELLLCVCLLLFCASGGIGPLQCLAQKSWGPLANFQHIIDAIVEKCSGHETVYYALVKLLKNGGLETFNNHSITWMHQIATKHHKSKNFWQNNDVLTVDILNLILAACPSPSDEEKAGLSFIIDVLIENGIRSAELLRLERYKSHNLKVSA